MAQPKVRELTIASASRKELGSRAKPVKIEGHEYPGYVQIGIQYAEMVALKKIPACRYLIMAAERFLRMYEEAQKPGNEFYWSDEHAIEVCAFIETLPHVKGVLAKTPFILEPWQIWILIAIYGFRWSDTHDRVVTVAQLEITRKSGKSLLAAGIAFYELGPNAYVGDDLYIIAPTKDLANKVLEPMKKMLEFKPELANYYGAATFSEKIDFDRTDSYAVTLSAAGKKQDGHDPKVVIADEFHSLPASIFNVMKSAQGARPESLFLEIGSAGYNTHGVGWEERKSAIDVLEGKRSQSELFCAIWGVDVQDIGNWRNDRVIRKANPNYGISNPVRKAKQEIEAIFTSPRNKNEVLRTRFNIWGLGEGRLIPSTDWDACADPDMKLSDFDGQIGWIGVDLASRLDMICYVLMFEETDLGNISVFAKHYVPEDGPWREDEELREFYEEWHKAGYLAFTPGSSHSYTEILLDLDELHQNHSIELTAVDDREANMFMSSMDQKGWPVAAHRKNAAQFSEPTRDIQARTYGPRKTIRHDGNPVLAWNVENTIGASNTADLILPKKESEHSTAKIDGFDAMCIANACRMNTVETRKTKKPNPMAERGVRGGE